MPVPISKEFKQWLQDYDKRLTASWSNLHGCFIVQHKDTRGKMYIVLKTDRLDRRAKESIYAQDMRRWGGGLKMLDTLEEQEEAKRIGIHEREMSEHEDMAADAYEHMKYKQGETVYQ